MNLLVPLRFTIPAVLAIVCLVPSGVFVWFEGRSRIVQIEDEMLESAMTTGIRYARRLEYYLANNERAAATRDVLEMRTMSDLRRAILVDESDQELGATTGAPETGAPETGAVPQRSRESLARMSAEARSQRVPQLEVTSDRGTVAAAFHVQLGLLPGEFRPSRIGVLYLELDLVQQKTAERLALVTRVGTVAGLALVAFGLGWVYLEWALTRRAAQLVAVTDQLASGHLSFRAALAGADELATLSHAIDRMATSLEAHRAAERQQEARYQLAVELSGIGVWEMDLGTGKARFSPQWKRQLGYSDDEIVDDVAEWETRIHPDDRDRMLGLARASRVGELRGPAAEYRLRHKDGTYRWIAMKGTVLSDATGKAVHALGCNLDVTNRVEAERALSAQAQRLWSVLDGMRVFVAVVSTDGIVLEVNRAALEVSGLRAQDLVGQRVVDTPWCAGRPESLAQITAVIDRVKAGAVVREDFAIPSVGGDNVVIDSVFAPLLDPSGRVTHIVCSGIDVTTRERMEANLRKSEGHVRAILEAEPECVKTVDSGGNILEINGAGLAMLELDSLEGLSDRSCLQFVLPPHREAFTALHQSVMRGGSGTLEFEAVGLKGGRRWLETHAVPLHGQQGTVISLLGVTRDVSERKGQRDALEAANTRLHNLSARLLDVQETERRTLARELHDEIGQALTLTKMNLQRIDRLDNQAELSARVTMATDVVGHALEQVRSLSLALRPPLLDELGLAPALRWLVDRFAQGGQPVTFVVDRADVRMDPSVEIACFRIAQEALNNAAKHASASVVSVTMRLEGRTLDLHVHDDGRGFDPATARLRAAAGASLGLLSMEERAALAGGHIDWTSELGRGTDVHARFELEVIDGVSTASLNAIGRRALGSGPRSRQRRVRAGLPREPRL